MKNIQCLCASLLLAVSGCAAHLVPYQVRVESEPIGARIESNNDYVGIAPTEFTIYGDPDGTFHGEGWHIIRAIPPPGTTNLHVQTKRFWRGGFFQPEAQIPKRVYFDLTLPPEDDSTLNLNTVKP